MTALGGSKEQFPSSSLVFCPLERLTSLFFLVRHFSSFLFRFCCSISCFPPFKSWKKEKNKGYAFCNDRRRAFAVIILRKVRKYSIPVYGPFSPRPESLLPSLFPLILIKSPSFPVCNLQLLLFICSPLLTPQNVSSWPLVCGIFISLPRICLHLSFLFEKTYQINAGRGNDSSPFRPLAS